MTKLAFACALLLGLSINAASQTPSTKIDTNSGPATEGPAPTSCDGKNFPIDKGGSPSCCRVGADMFHVVLRPGQPFGEERLAHRQLGTACTMDDGSTSCNTDGSNSYPKCSYGPCGVKIVKVWDGSHSEVFQPHSQPLACGYQTTVG